MSGSILEWDTFKQCSSGAGVPFIEKQKKYRKSVVAKAVSTTLFWHNTELKLFLLNINTSSNKNPFHLLGIRFS